MNLQRHTQVKTLSGLHHQNVVRYFQAWIEGSSGETQGGGDEEEEEDDEGSDVFDESSSESESEGSDQDAVEDTVFTKSFVESQKRARKANQAGRGVRHDAEGATAHDSADPQVMGGGGEGEGCQQKAGSGEEAAARACSAEGVEGAAGGGRDGGVAACGFSRGEGAEREMSVAGKAGGLSKVDSWSSGYSSSDGAAGEI